MVYLTFDPSNPKVALEFSKVHQQTINELRLYLPDLGVAKDDIVIKILNPNNFAVSDPQHLEIILKTDRNWVTAPEIVKILSPIIKVPFEVTRIYVGYEITEMFVELWAFIVSHRRNWASNYEKPLSL